MLDDWQITHELLDMPPNVWRVSSRSRRFFAMIIPKEYGGLGFSPLASSMVLAKVASRSATAASTIGVPNSLGPAELLLHYGTDEQKQRWLPRLACGEEVPCFALTSPRVGSDATALIDSGVVAKGMWEGQRDRRHPPELGQALHHARAGRDRARPRVQALRSGAPDRRGRRVRHHGRADSDEPARHRDRPAALPDQHPFPERPHARQGRVRAARRDHRRHRRWRARAGACSCSSSSVGRSIVLPSNALGAAIGRRLRHRRVRKLAPPVQPADRQVSRRRAKRSRAWPATSTS